jgi:DNA end-binding protein Ku
MARPYWSGQIRISLVGFAVDIFPATQRGSQVPLHEYDRRNGERIRHQNLNDSGDPVEYDDIVKGYEFEKNDAVLLEKDEIDSLKLPSSDALELTEFIPAAALQPIRYERPYFILPHKKTDAAIYQVVREALEASGMVGIGQITLRGREELCAVGALKKGLSLETLRYDAELLDPDEFFADLHDAKIRKDEVALARRLIEQNTGKPDFGRFHDHYHEALLDLIDSKRHKRKPHFTKGAPIPAKVIDFMDALQRSLKSGKSKPSQSPARKQG